MTSERPAASDVPGSEAILDAIADGVAILDPSGQPTWSNDRWDALPGPVRQWCREMGETGETPRSSIVETEARRWRIDARPAPIEAMGVVVVVYEVTTEQAQQVRIDAIQEAGSALTKLVAETVSTRNLAERLRILRDRVITCVHDHLNFDNFEVRLLDRDSNQLELVIALNISPLKIGEIIFAEPENNGISGHVAATGTSYLCPDVRTDPRYRKGLDDAASSLTVPLTLHDKVIGVFNAESYTPAAFDETDLRLTEILARSIAVAMNMLDMLVVERSMTNAQTAKNLLDELDSPLGALRDAAQTLRDDDPPKAARERLAEDIIEGTAAVRQRVEACTSGPRMILDAEQAIRKLKPDPHLTGRRALVADDEEQIRTGAEAILGQLGFEVVSCADGRATIEAIEASMVEERPFDLVLSDIKMPDRNGYEVFHAARSVSPETAVILMTGFGYDPHHSIVRSSQEGLSVILFKPFKTSQLVEAITKVLSPAKA